MQMLREALDKWPVWGKHASDDGEDEAFCAGWKSAWAMLDREGFLDLRIIDDAAVALDLEAGAEALEACHSKPMNRDITRGIVSAILTACNIIVPDEVHEGEFEDQGYGDHWLNPAIDNLSTWCKSGERYTITVTRKSTLHPPVNEEND